ncbi:DUF6270 domain-containing protein [Paenibacillus illinoisensis]|uniref:DUF6270 domain-containing protein n=1 Tax=Paenibacillus illinoisensis TaxID=59845 RepID=UPI003AFAB87E
MYYERFRIAKEETNIEYYARSSLISLMSSPLTIANTDIKLDSKFQLNMILNDFKRTS